MPGFAHTVIRASAGTGKTFQLSNRFLGLVAAGEPADHVLATTFARKAAGEILDRVLLRLAEAVEDREKCTELAEHLRVQELDCERCAALLQLLIRRLHRLRIGTLDAFFIQLAGIVGLELGFPPGWRICEEIEDERLKWEAIQEVLRNEQTNDVVQLMHLLSKGELRRSVAEQMLSVVRDLYGLFLETDEAAWRKLVRRREMTPDELTLALELLAQFDGLPVHKTIHNAHITAVERVRNTEWAEFLKGGIAAMLLAGKEDYCQKRISQETIDVYRPVVEHGLAVLVNRIVMQTDASWHLLSRFHEAYQKLKRERRAMRFEDVTRELSLGLHAIGAHDVAFRMDAHIAHLLLDEFQDTSLPQWSVLRPAAEKITAGRASDSFFCVGDVKQAIYGWRGGVAAVFEAVTERLPNLTLEPLNRSFRSSPPVIATVNSVFSQLHEAAPLAERELVRDLWRKRFQEHSTARSTLRGYCRLVTGPRAEGSGQGLRTLQFAAGMVAELARRSPGRSIGVLVRRNEVVGRLTYELREKHGVAASEEGGNPLTDSTGVQVILSAMALADHPGDMAARFHLAHSPLAATLELTNWNDGGAALRASRKIREILLRDGYGRTVAGWVKTMAPSFDERELKRMLQLVELAYRYESQATVRGDDFAAFVQQTRVEDPSGAPVRVMTIHQAKGLEFDIVVLPELDGRLVGQVPPVLTGRDDPLGPITRVIRYAGDPVKSMLPSEFRELYDVQEADRVSESLCVLYVAMTRAVHELHMVIAPANEKEKKIPSTYAGVLRSTLSPAGGAPENSVLFECGDTEWWRGESGAAGDEGEGETKRGGDGVIVSSRSVSPSPPLLVSPSPSLDPVRLAPTPARRTRGLRRASPSGREGGGHVNLKRMLRLESSVAMARGTLIHKWFEQVGWLEDGIPDDAALTAAAAGLVPPELSLPRELAEFRAMLKRPAIREALSRSGYAAAPSRRASGSRSGEKLPGEVPRDVRAGVAAGTITLRVEPERTFAYRTETEIVPGSIDRLVTFLSDGRPVAAEILDFKTDAVSDPEDLEEAVEHYRPQMDAYRQAVARITHVRAEHVGVRLLFVGEGIVRCV